MNRVLKVEKLKRECALASCRKKFKPVTSWHIYHNRRCKQIAWHLSAARKLRNEVLESEGVQTNGGE